MAYKYIYIKISKPHNNSSGKFQVSKDQEIKKSSLRLCFLTAADKPENPQGFWLSIPSPSPVESVFIKWEDIIIEPNNHNRDIDNITIDDYDNHFKVSILPLEIQFKLHYPARGLENQYLLDYFLKKNETGNYCFCTNNMNEEGKKIPVTYKDIEVALENFNRFYVLQRRYEMQLQRVSKSVWKHTFADSIDMLMDRFSSDYSKIPQYNDIVSAVAKFKNIKLKNPNLENTNHALIYVNELCNRSSNEIGINHQTESSTSKKIALLEWLVKVLLNIQYQDRYGAKHKFNKDLVTDSTNKNFRINVNFSELDYRQKNKLETNDIKEFIKLKDSHNEMTVYDFFHGKLHKINLAKFNFSENIYTLQLKNEKSTLTALACNQASEFKNASELIETQPIDTSDLPINQESIDEALYIFNRFHINPLLKELAQVKQKFSFFDLKRYQSSYYENNAPENSLWNLVYFTNSNTTHSFDTISFLQSEFFNTLPDKIEDNTEVSKLIKISEGLQQFGKHVKGGDHEYQHQNTESNKDETSSSKKIFL